MQPIVIWCNNHSAIHISKEPMEHQCTKHIEVHMHFIQRLIHEQIIGLQYCRIELQVADIFTKPLAQTRFVQLRALLGVNGIVLEGGYSQFSSIFSYLCFDNFVPWQVLLPRRIFVYFCVFLSLKAGCWCTLQLISRR